MLEFETTGDELACSSYSLQDEYEGADSLHVLPYMTGYRITIKPKYEIIAGEAYCDIVDDNLKLRVING
eukprot:8576809-Ditylum_brightwellii.AAC.1